MLFEDSPNGHSAIGFGLSGGTNSTIVTPDAIAMGMIEVFKDDIVINGIMAIIDSGDVSYDRLLRLRILYGDLRYARAIVF